MAVVRRKVLIVDDDESIIRLICRALEEREIDCATARNGVDALQQMAIERYAVVILDLVMPNLSGVELIERMRELMIQPPIIIVITAHAKEFRGKLDTTLVNAIIRKPFDASELADMVKSCISAPGAA